MKYLKTMLLIVGRAALKFSPALIIFTLCGLTSAGAARGNGANADDQSTVKSASDIVFVTTGKYSNTIFLVVPDAGAIYSYKLTADSPMLIDFSLFRVFFKSAEFTRPSALAYWNEKLIVCDKDLPALFAVDLDTLNAQQLYKGVPLEEPSAVTVSDNGTVAVAGHDSPNIVLLKPQSGPQVLKQQEETDEARRLIYVGSHLLVLNEKSGVYNVTEEASKQSVATLQAIQQQSTAPPSPTPPSVTQATNEQPAPPVQVREIFPTPANLTTFTKLNDFAYQNGIFYTSNRIGVDVVARSIDASPTATSEAAKGLRLTITSAEAPTPMRLAVSEDRLFVVDAKNRAVWNLPRPTPVEIRFESSDESSTAAQIKLYRYLFEKKLLPVSAQKSLSDDETLEELLRRRKILISKLPPSGLEQEKNQLVQLICQFNQNFCASNAPQNAQLLNKKIDTDEELVLPNLNLREYLTFGTVNLNGRTVAARLEELIPSQSLREKYSAMTLAYKLNGRVTPADRQAFLTKTDGSITLPLMRWRTTALVPATDLANPSSPLRQLPIAHQGLRLLSKEETTGGASSSGCVSCLLNGAFAAPQSFVDVERDRRTLKNIINFPAALPDMSDITIGVAEHKSTVDDKHLDFFDNGVSAWRPLTVEELSPPEEEDQPAPVAPAPPPPAPTPTPTPTPDRSVQPEEIDTAHEHGTHVAGILGARANSHAPGLLPTVQMFLVDSTRESSLITDIEQRAIMLRDIFIFNLSQEFDTDDYDDLVKIKDQWQFQLFIASVGNDNKNFQSALATKAPILWRLPNVIGVSALTTVENLSDIDIMPGANYGKRYTHLVAPGHHIYSTTPLNTYKKASGTSQAAPQVTAAAALLFKLGVREPKRIKARLIYTAEYLPRLQDKVWGGLLHVSRATFEPGRNLMMTYTVAGKVRAVTLDPNPNNSIKIREGMLDDPEATSSVSISNESIPYPHILRITSQSNGQGYRIIFLKIENGAKRLKIVYNARISGKIRCREFQEWDATATPAAFKGPARCQDDTAYREGINVQSISDYIARTPEKADF